MSKNKTGVKRMTRNRKRKADYAAKAAAERKDSAGKGKHLMKKRGRKVRLVGSAKHRVPCGNVACTSCYNR
jgi:hypothetical protein